MNVCIRGPAKYFALGPLEALIRPCVSDVFVVQEEHEDRDVTVADAGDAGCLH